MPIPLGFLVASSLLTNLANRQISQEQMQHEKDMVDFQNDYNLPANQMQRLKDAGINPTSLGMGNGTVVTGNTSASPNPYTAAYMQDPLASASNAMLAQMQAQESGEKALSESTFREERLRNLQLNNDKYKQEIVMLGLDQRAQQIANDYAAALNEVALNEGAARIDRTRAEINEINQRIEESQQYILQKLPAEVQKIISEIGINVLEQDKVVAEIQRIYADKANIEQDTDFKAAQTATEGARQLNLDTDSALNVQNATYVQQQVKLYLDTWEDQINKIAAESKLSVKEARWYVAGKIFEGLRSVGGVAGGAAAAVKVFAK